MIQEFWRISKYLQNFQIQLCDFPANCSKPEQGKNPSHNQAFKKKSFCFEYIASLDWGTFNSNTAKQT